MQFAAVFLLALALVGAAFYLILDRIYVNQLKSQAETVADNVDAFGSWVAQYGRVWVKDDDKSYLGHLSLLQPDDPAAGAASAKLTPVATSSTSWRSPPSGCGSASTWRSSGWPSAADRGGAAAWRAPPPRRLL